jgi:hypothetical protein
MGRKQEAIGIALQPQLGTIRPIHKRLYCNYDEFPVDAETLACTLALTIALVQEHPLFPEECHHSLTTRTN